MIKMNELSAIEQIIKHIKEKREAYLQDLFQSTQDLLLEDAKDDEQTFYHLKEDFLEYLSFQEKESFSSLKSLYFLHTPKEKVLIFEEATYDYIKMWSFTRNIINSNKKTWDQYKHLFDLLKKHKDSYILELKKKN